MNLKELVNLVKTKKIFEPILFAVNFILFVSDILIFKPKIKTKNKKILFIKTNVIGDYFFFRSFFELIRKDNKYKDYQIDLIGNILWKPIFEEYDSKYIDNVYWLDIYKFSTNIIYRRNIIKNLPSLEYDLILNPVASRIFVVDDLLIRKLNGKSKIGFVSFLHNIKNWEAWIGNHFYTKLINTENLQFDFDVNKHFIKQALGLSFTDLKMNLECYNKNELKYNKNYVVFVPGAGDKFRQWNTLNFAKVAEYILCNTDMNIYISGSKSEFDLCQKIVDDILFLNKENRIFNLSENLSLIDLINLIDKSTFIVTSDSSSVPISVSLKKRCICITNGKNFARFNPYPKEYKEYITTIYPPSMRKMVEKDFDKLITLNMYNSKFDVNETSYSEIINIVAQIIQAS
ncbi:MAG: lipopolysaccharide heptosyltransferase family protein [Bacteroidetes bacterium]|nr:MAG: lipopolysaccharide heptosyltransferase family protein [Bacteroidota bacterium]